MRGSAGQRVAHSQGVVIDSRRAARCQRAPIGRRWARPADQMAAGYRPPPEPICNGPLALQLFGTMQSRAAIGAATAAGRPIVADAGSPLRLRVLISAAAETLGADIRLPPRSVSVLLGPSSAQLLSDRSGNRRETGAART